MSLFLELQRSKLEEIDVIREATSKRFRRNPALIPKDIRKKDDVLAEKSKPFKQTMLQKYELKLFQDRYKARVDALQSLDRDVIKKSIDDITDPQMSFTSFDNSLERILNNNRDFWYSGNLRSTYNMYSLAPVDQIVENKKSKAKAKRQHVLSQEAASEIELSRIFTPEEHYGTYLDLHKFYDWYNSLKETKISYREYLSLFDKVPSTGIRDYKDYVSELSSYLESFLCRINPLLDRLTYEQEIMSAFQNENSFEDGTSNHKGEVYCKACDKLFTKETVYKGHLDGKKHKKNEKKLGNSEQKVISLSLAQFFEFKIKYLCNLLKDTIQETITNVERQEGMSEREKMIEALELAEKDSEYSAIDSDSEANQSEDDNSDYESGAFKDLPLGADGNPIPYWLYKLQGLHRSYTCEICGNLSYKGRVTFEKHFSSVKHQKGLKFLGIESNKMSLFTNITNIQEAQELWAILRKQARLQEGEADDAVEVEDAEGNVMTERDFLQLKKQGII